MKYATPKKPAQTWTESLVNSKLVKWADNLDRKWSTKIHKLDLPAILQAYIAFFALICNKEGPVLLMGICSCIFPHFKEEKQPYHFLFYAP